MSVKKLVVLLLAPLALIALVPLFAPDLFSTENDASGDALARLVGQIYGAYFGALLAWFVIRRVRQRT